MLIFIYIILWCSKLFVCVSIPLLDILLDSFILRNGIMIVAWKLNCLILHVNARRLKGHDDIGRVVVGAVDHWFRAVKNHVLLNLIAIALHQELDILITHWVHWLIDCLNVHVAIRVVKLVGRRPWLALRLVVHIAARVSCFDLQEHLTTGGILSIEGGQVL